MAQLIPFTIEIVHPDIPNESILVLAFNACHAVNLVYRYLDTIGRLNVSKHGHVIEHTDFLSPNYFKNGSK